MNTRPDNGKLRRMLRQQRRELPTTQARACALQLARHAVHHPLVRNCRHIGAYIAVNGEMDPAPLLERLRAEGKIIYLPVLIPFREGKLWFARHEPGADLVHNRFGIPEPVARQLVNPAMLDLVLTPLVACDPAGHRVGMGGGFYDRSFAFRRWRRHWHKPLLLGMAYRFQLQQAIAPNRWDVALDAIATEQGVLRASHSQDTSD